jgi:hypothetical protein
MSPPVISQKRWDDYGKVERNGVGALLRNARPWPWLPRDADLVAFEAGLRGLCEREVGEVEWQISWVDLHPGAGETTRRAGNRLRLADAV